MSARVVLFDFYGTLGYLRPPSDHIRIQDLFLMHQAEWQKDLSRKWSMDRLDGRDHSQWSISEATYTTWRIARTRRYLTEVGLEGERLESLLDDLLIWQRSFRPKIFRETKKVLIQLRDLGFDLGVCSNWDWNLEDLLLELGIANLFKTIVVSAKAGFRKPHPRIFLETLTSLNVQPWEAIFVGDSWETDIEGALRVGMRGVFIDRSGRKTGPLAVLEDVVCIRSLDALPAIVSQAYGGEVVP